MATSYDIMKMARDTTINWAANNPTLGEGEPGYDITLKRFKIGDGTTAWNSLAFQAAVGPTGATGAGYGGTSVTPLTIGTGAQSLTTQAGLAYNTGDWAMIVDSAGTSNWMIGQVTSYSGTAMVVDVTLTNGSGTISTWNISLTGARGAQGATGTSVPVVAAGGTPDVITGAYSPAITVLTDMLRVDFVASAANVTVTPTFQANSTAAHVITKRGGGPLGVDIPGALAVCQLQYNLANTRWELLNPATSSSSSVVSETALCNLLYPSVKGGWQDIVKSGWKPVFFNQQWGGAPILGGLDGNLCMDYATGAIQLDADVAFGGYTNIWMRSQGFKTSQTLTIAAAYVKIYKVLNPTDNVVAYIYSDAAGKPDAAIANGTG